jgi:16S rRNA (uracil1498-N3)-methyltransferase
LEFVVSERFFSSEPIVADRITLGGAEAHHLIHVMRAAEGDSVTLFDGSGAEFTATIEKCGRSEVELRIVARYDVDRELSFELSVGVALPKGDRQKWLVEKLTELGVTTLIPLETQRGVAQPNPAALDRLARTVIEATKQCGRNQLMEITKSQTWFKWVLSGEASEMERRLVAHPGGKGLSQVDLSPRLNTRLAIGPEGGFTDSEIEAATRHEWQLVDLGPRILRVETAAVALSAAVALLNPLLAPP